MSAVMGAGKKESNNTFTGLLLGDLPKVENENKTGLLGYEHGEQAYGIFDDGTMFLGKSSRAQLRLSGTEGVIENVGYSAGTGGIKIDFDGALTGTKATLPYIDLKASTGAQVYLGTGGQPTANLYFSIKSPNSANGGNNNELIHIGKQQYYLQTDNYSDTNKTGLKIDLKEGSLKGYDNLTLQGGTLGQNNSIYLSTNNATANVAGQTNKNNWRVTVGSNFGVDADGNMFATNGNLAGKITANEGTIGGFNISSSQNTAFNDGHFYVNSLYSHPLGIDGKDYEVGMQGGTTEKGLAFYVKRKNANED